MNKRLEFALSLFWRYLIHSCVWGTFGLAALVTMVLMQSGAFQFSDYNARSLYEPSEFMLHVSADGTTVYESAQNVSKALRETIMQEVYPSPEAAVEAVEGPLPGNPALAHAVNICTHSDGKVSNQTGAGRHITKFRFHKDGRHYTRTDHQVLTQYGYQTTEIYYYDVSRKYCGCN